MQRACSSSVLLGVLLVSLIGFFTYFWNFSTPQAFFWDENYHIASAQKYLNGTFFMEPHPPLGKLMIAAGEYLLDLNETDNQFIGTDYGKNPPPGFSFTGYRLFPAMLAWLTAPVLFLVFYLLTKNTLFSVLFSFLYLFDNALIVHLRGAMLEPPYIFFSALTILSFLLLLQHKDRPTAFLLSSLLFGASFAAVMLTKILGLVLILLVPALFVMLWPHWRKFMHFLPLAVTAFAIPYMAIWQMHFSIAENINPSLPDQGYYQASDEYKQLLAAGHNRNPLYFPYMLRDSWNFVGHYAQGVPKLDLCKADENGSPFFLWPIGGRAINYRWETPDGFAYKYLYLQVNPVVWWGVLLGVLLGISLLLAHACLPLKEKLHRPLLLAVFLGLYLSFMAATSMLDRVMYLYHYFLPLLFGFCVLALSLLEVRKIFHFTLTPARQTVLLTLFGMLIFAGFQLMHPFSYYEPVTDAQFRSRAFFRLWEAHCVNCPRESVMVQTRR